MPLFSSPVNLLRSPPPQSVALKPLSHPQAQHRRNPPRLFGRSPHILARRQLFLNPPPSPQALQSIHLSYRDQYFHGHHKRVFLRRLAPPLQLVTRHRHPDLGGRDQPAELVPSETRRTSCQGQGYRHAAPWPKSVTS